MTPPVQAEIDAARRAADWLIETPDIRNLIPFRTFRRSHPLIEARNFDTAAVVVKPIAERFALEQELCALTLLDDLFPLGSTGRLFGVGP